MKKLLSLLSVLTITGTAVPTTIAASLYQKEEKLNNNINLEINNLENLKRIKRTGEERSANSFIHFKHLGEIRNKNKKTILDALWDLNPNISAGLFQKLKVISVEENRALIRVVPKRGQSASFSAYYGETYVYFRVNRNFLQLQPSSSRNTNYDNDEL